MAELHQQVCHVAVDRGENARAFEIHRVALLERFVAAQVPRYADLRTPTVIITGDRDTMVSPQSNARVLAATLPGAKLVLLKDVGHMPHHAAPEVIANAIEELVSRVALPSASMCPPNAPGANQMSVQNLNGRDAHPAAAWSRLPTISLMSTAG